MLQTCHATNPSPSASRWPTVLGSQSSSSVLGTSVLLGDLLGSSSSQSLPPELGYFRAKRQSRVASSPPVDEDADGVMKSRD